MGFPDSSVGKESACNAEDPGSIPGSRRSPGERIGYPLQSSWASLVAQLVKNLLAMWETWVWSLGWEDPLEKGKAIHSSILAWRISWTVWSMGSQRVGHDSATLTLTLIAQLVKNPPAMQGPQFKSWVRKIPWRRDRLPTLVFWPGEFHRLYVCRSPWGGKESDTTEQLSLSLLFLLVFFLNLIILIWLHFAVYFLTQCGNVQIPPSHPIKLYLIVLCSLIKVYCHLFSRSCMDWNSSVYRDKK